MSEALFSPLLERAVRLAAQAHHHQDRKGSGAPYFTHLAGVALILARAGFRDDRLLAAAVLHDVVEDTDVSLAQLAEQFPADVLELVAALSERKTDERGEKRPWEDRKAEHLEHVARSSRAARAIVLADKLHNLESMLFDLESGTLQLAAFKAPPERIVWYYEQMIDRAAGNDADLRPLVEACASALERLRERFHHPAK
jgi:(p)ppGpp synthase/HD superfamily hydrolase